MPPTRRRNTTGPAKIFASALLAATLASPTALAATVAWGSNHVDTATFTCGGSQVGLGVHAAAATGGNFQGGVLTMMSTFNEAGSLADDNWFFRFEVGDDATSRLFTDTFGSTDGGCDNKLSITVPSGVLLKWFYMEAEVKHGTKGWGCWWCAYSWHWTMSEAQIKLPVPFNGGGGVGGGGDPGGY